MPLSSVPHAKILLVEDERLLGKSIQRYLSEHHQCEWFESVEAAIGFLRNESVDIIVSDIKLPGKSGLDLLHWVLEYQPQTPIILITAHSSIPDAVKAIREGAADYLSKPLDLATLELSVARVLRNTRLQQEVRYHRQQARQIGEGAEPFALTSSAYAEIEARVQRLLSIENQSGEAPSILITGETGTGKGVLARRIHQQSPRSAEPFIEINSTAIPETMVESELFGHEKGAFTGAVSQRAGLFELANGGTIFLDEIGHIPLGLQAKLLKVIEDKRIRRIGGGRETELDVRIIAATNIDLAQAVREGTFREDLYHRLALIHLHLPPLRGMAEEIPALAQEFLREALRKYAMPHDSNQLHLSVDNERMLKQHSWPGNIRELKNEVERSVLFHGLDQLSFTHLQHLQTPSAPMPLAASSSSKGPLFQLPEDGLALLEVEPRILAQALQQTSGDPDAAARLLHMTEKEFEFRLQRHHFDWTQAPGWEHPIPEDGVDLTLLEQNLLKQALEQTRHNVTGAARLLNLSRDQMRYRLEKHGLDS